MDVAGLGEKTPTQELALWAVQLRPADLPFDVIELAKDCLLDHVAVSLHGMRQPWSGFVANQVEVEAGAAHASVYGRGVRVPARAASLANGTAAHAFELDDWHGASLAHLGACVIPAVLAVAERHHLSGARVLAAIVAGFEVMARCGMSVVPSVISRGFHPTGTHGPMGAAAGVANLLKLTPEQATSAIGIAVSCAAGLMEFSRDAQGMMVKRFHAGRAAEAGVLAADLALRGMTGPKSALEGRFGYSHVFSEAPKPELLTRALGQDFEIRHNNIKLYACCGAMHAAIDAVDEMMAEHRFAQDDVASIVFGGNQVHVSRHSGASPDSVMAAQYSMPYAIAVALTGRALDPRMFDEGAYSDPALLRLAGLVRVELHPEVEKAYPDSLGAHLRITLKDGRALQKLRLQARGTGDDMIGRAEILKKSVSLCSPFMDKVAMDRLFECVLSFERLDDVAHLARLMDCATGAA
jgi:2-methylcitrate dehydratase PrpD